MYTPPSLSRSAQHQALPLPAIESGTARATLLSAAAHFAARPRSCAAHHASRSDRRSSHQQHPRNTRAALCCRNRPPMGCGCSWCVQNENPKQRLAESKPAGRCPSASVAIVRSSCSTSSYTWSSFRTRSWSSVRSANVSIGLRPNLRLNSLYLGPPGRAPATDRWPPYRTSDCRGCSTRA